MRLLAARGLSWSFRGPYPVPTEAGSDLEVA